MLSVVLLTYTIYVELVAPFYSLVEAVAGGVTGVALKILRDMMEDERDWCEEQELVDALYAATLRDDVSIVDRLLQVSGCIVCCYTQR